MRYVEFRDVIEQELRRTPDGLTWRELRDRLDLPYTRACPTWIQRLEEDLRLTREKGAGRALVWRVPTHRLSRDAFDAAVRVIET